MHFVQDSFHVYLNKSERLVGTELELRNVYLDQL